MTSVESLAGGGKARRRRASRPGALLVTIVLGATIATAPPFVASGERIREGSSARSASQSPRVDVVGVGDKPKERPCRQVANKPWRN